MSCGAIIAPIEDERYTLTKRFHSCMEGLKAFLASRYNDAMLRYPVDGMSAWYSQRIIYTLNRLLVTAALSSLSVQEASCLSGSRMGAISGTPRT